MLLQPSMSLRNFSFCSPLASGWTNEHYRCGRFEEALKVLPKHGDTFQVPVSLLVQAMVHQRLGHEDEARRLLRQGIAEMEQRIPTIDGPPLADYMPARWVVWTTHQVLRREAEKLIDDETNR
ncbi:MAG: tetratricopeptide repeat protein [Planctomycetes bacterium]|nr:tetratricopeptide repeat protein [Planctomycetota bacterium]MBL7040972.1 tetratricopeptide repeat protein [Pirellulaceae bacterium]